MKRPVSCRCRKHRRTGRVRRPCSVHPWSRPGRRPRSRGSGSGPARAEAPCASCRQAPRRRRGSVHASDGRVRPGPRLRWTRRPRAGSPLRAPRPHAAPHRPRRFRRARECGRHPADGPSPDAAPSRAPPHPTRPSRPAKTTVCPDQPIGVGRSRYSPGPGSHTYAGRSSAAINSAPKPATSSSFGSR